MKRFLWVLLTVVLCVSLIAGCAQTKKSSSNNSAALSAAPGAAPGAPFSSLEFNRTEGTEVFFTQDISSQGLMRVYQALDAEPAGRIAVKLSTGEPPNSNYLRPELIKELVQHLRGTIVECNTAYGGRRGNSQFHLQVAKDHGFTDIAEVDILDSEAEIAIPVTGGEVLEENIVGSHFTNYDYYVILSHFKGHIMAGFGGAVKNISIGISSSEGKVWIHSGGTRTDGGINGDNDSFQMAMAEASLSVSDALSGGENIVYINVMNRLSVDCDCNGNPAEPDMHDIGILASHDPVALDQACLDLIWEADGNESFVERVESRNAFLALEHGEKIGLGTRRYRMRAFLSLWVLGTKQKKNKD